MISKTHTTYHLMLLLPMILLIGTTIFPSCSTTVENSTKPVITVSILPQKYFLDRLCEDAFTVQVMIPPGESPATYDPSPRQMIDLNNSGIYFLTGQLVFENTWIREVMSQNRNTKFWDTSKGIDFIRTEENHGDHVHGIMDPHIWMSPKNVKIMCRNMARELQLAYPELADELDTNLNILYRELDSLDTKISSELMTECQSEFIIYHPALTYFARDYGLTQIAIEKDGKEPSSRYMKKVIDEARQNNVRVIFIQRQFNQQEANTVRNEINGQVVVIDPLDYHWMEQMDLITRSLKSQKLHHE